MDQSQHSHQKNLRAFAIILLVAEIVVVILYGAFVRFTVHTNDLAISYYPAYQDVNVMMLIGFGFLMTFVKRHSLSALGYTFFLNAIIVQYYILLNAFWNKVFTTGFNSMYIELDEKSFIAASYSVASVLIAFGGVLGRVGPLELLLMGLVQIVGYTFNEALVYHVIKVFDVGGSMAIHTFGAYFGLTVSFIIGKAVPPVGKIPTTYNSNAFAFIGTLFLWMFWPSFNAGYFPVTGYQKTQVISNTILALTASCLSTFMFSAFRKEKIQVEDILNATLSGGVIIGAPSGLLYHPGGALAIGLLAGIISTFGYHFMTQKLKNIGIYDTCGIHNLHGMPGVLGGILSAIIVASYNAMNTIDPQVTIQTYLPFYSIAANPSFLKQGGLQILGTVCSLGLAILFGIVAGYILRAVYAFKAQEFFKDDIYFELAEESTEKFNKNPVIQVTKVELQQFDKN